MVIALTEMDLILVPIIDQIDYVIFTTGIDGISTCAGMDLVITILAPKVVIAIIANYGVVPGICIDLVITDSAKDDVIIVPCGDFVIAGKAVQCLSEPDFEVIDFIISSAAVNMGFRGCPAE